MVDPVKLERLWVINPAGNKQAVETTLNSILDPKFNIRTPEGDILTIDYIIDKYKNYLEYWKTRFGKTEERYIPKSDKKKELYDYLSEGMWKNNYSITDNPRDIYLFGGYDRKFLEKRTEQFLSKFNKDKNGERTEPEPTIEETPKEDTGPAPF